MEAKMLGFVKMNNNTIGINELDIQGNKTEHEVCVQHYFDMMQMMNGGSDRAIYRRIDMCIYMMILCCASIQLILQYTN